MMYIINADECSTYSEIEQAKAICCCTNGSKPILCPCPCATFTSSIPLHSTNFPSDMSTATTNTSESDMSTSYSFDPTSLLVSSFLSASTMSLLYHSTSSDNTPSRSSLNSILIATTIAIGILLPLLTCAILSLTIAIISNRRYKQRNILHHANSQSNIYEELNRATLQGNSEYMTLDEWRRGTDQDQPGSSCIVTKGRCPSVQSSEYETVPDVRSAYLDQIKQSSVINSNSSCFPSSSVRHDLSTGQQWEYAMVSDTEASVDFKDIDVLREQIPTGELVSRMNNGEIESEYSVLGEDNYELRCTKITSTNISKPATQQECSGKNGKEDEGPTSVQCCKEESQREGACYETSCQWT